MTITEKISRWLLNHSGKEQDHGFKLGKKTICIFFNHIKNREWKECAFILSKFIEAQQYFWKWLKVRRRTIPVDIKIYSLDFLRGDEKAMIRFLRDSNELEMFEDSMVIDLIEST